MKPYSLPGRQGGLTLIELIVGMVILAVALTALMATIPVLSGSSSARDADALVRDGRSCAELLLALHSAGDLELTDSDNPVNWSSDNEAQNALESLCGADGLNISSNTANSAYDITITRGNVSPLLLRLPGGNDD